MNKTCRNCLYCWDDIEKCKAKKCMRAFNLVDAWSPRGDSIILCKDCKWHDNQDRATMWLPCMEIKTEDNFYCGYAEGYDDEDEMYV